MFILNNNDKDRNCHAIGNDDNGDDNGDDNDTDNDDNDDDNCLQIPAKQALFTVQDLIYFWTHFSY